MKYLKNLFLFKISHFNVSIIVKSVKIIEDQTKKNGFDPIKFKNRINGNP